ncbi:hypothetical protein [Bradyrhizobium neotropicale]|uniref:IrrE N-terminal-like domain-containing protein n=1 Tax=Bradyrhizobium neotropicale TaxID=1497615 RepID=A0A176ZIC6_9BRAD|nr:hypothetical protein [Bradyrhizobium neotropicale]OAF19642.1 hypothetical protein AXW67_36155 [Bradyrhizobium neotropicale]
MRKQPVPLVLAFTILLPFSFQLATARDVRSIEKPPIDVVGTVSDVVEAVLPYWTSKRPIAVSYRRTPDTAEIALFEIYNSKHVGNAIYKNNCVSAGWEKVIDCDLKMIDDLIDDFYLIPIFATKTNRQAVRESYRRNLLLWVLSHELGHLELGHGRSDFKEDIRGMNVFDAATQVKELSADERSIEIVGNMDRGPSGAYSAVLDIANSLVRKSVCPRTYPKVCNEMPRGVGLIYDYQSNAQPIRIRLSGAHPEFVARFLRILYLAAKDTSQGSGLAHEAKQAIDLLQVEARENEWQSLSRVFAR